MLIEDIMPPITLKEGYDLKFIQLTQPRQGITAQLVAIVIILEMEKILVLVLLEILQLP